MVIKELERNFSRIDSKIARILTKPLEGKEIEEKEGEELFYTQGRELAALLLTADVLRRKVKGDRVSFVIVRNINFSNICYTGCQFCGFARPSDSKEAWFYSEEEMADKAEEAWERGATEVCIQGGLVPGIEGVYYRDILRAIKKRVPKMHIHAFSPFEIQYGAWRMKTSERNFLMMLKENGLGSIPGTAAEILDTEIRQKLTKDKLSAEAWVEIIKTAHRLGIPSTATIMYGHVDRPVHWAAHIRLIRDIQKETGGFTEFVPLGFVHYDAPLYLNGYARPGATVDEHRKMHAVARLMLHGWIDNIQVSWVKLGPEMAKDILSCGANDFGGTLMEEKITMMAGGKNGQEITPETMIRLIRESGNKPVRRNTLYETVEEFSSPQSRGARERSPAALW